MGGNAITREYVELIANHLARRITKDEEMAGLILDALERRVRPRGKVLPFLRATVAAATYAAVGLLVGFGGADVLEAMQDDDRPGIRSAVGLMDGNYSLYVIERRLDDPPILRRILHIDPLSQADAMKMLGTPPPVSRSAS